ncbi:hypothetical protein C900_04176 [Fulvivirga imtechensis AK7]|uniref:Uncharacterized protein n=1 Tax=Fulvivirga imtechensis AK7 TaxID=1237149 RepID=L8K069_9BACT|nr:hypothetical protein C900_04176 [Fulvivirga imtechensis AK7]
MAKSIIIKKGKYLLHSWGTLEFYINAESLAVGSWQKQLAKKVMSTE